MEVEKWFKASPLRSIEGLHYSPHRPFPKQRAFLDLTCQEALYGGGAGPGKTDALLMCALKYVHVPGFSALVLRRDFRRLALPGSIMDRAHLWLGNKRSDARWSGQDKAYRFPNGSSIQFGYIDNPDDRYRYASSEYQMICWDELTEFRLSEDESNPYEFMFSRLRKPKGMPVPLCMRAASNPGNIGHGWVKRRFITEEAILALLDGKPRVFFADPETRDRAFVPALLQDNPAIDAKAYVANLMHLPAVTRARLLKGDWSVVEHAILQAAWLRYFQMKGDMLVPLDGHKDVVRAGIVNWHECRRFVTVDTAGTTKQRADERKGKPPSWSVAGVWDWWPGPRFLFLRHVWRDRVDWHGLKAGVRSVLREWGRPTCHIENAHHGPPLSAELTSEGFRTSLVNPVQAYMKGQSGVPGKVERSVPLQNMLEEGRLFLPQADNSWVPDLEAEWLSWTGDEDETADQVDMASYAAALCDGGNVSSGDMVLSAPVISRMGISNYGLGPR